MNFKSLRWVAEIVYEDVFSVCEGELRGVHTKRIEKRRGCGTHYTRLLRSAWRLDESSV